MPLARYLFKKSRFFSESIVGEIVVKSPSGDSLSPRPPSPPSLPLPCPSLLSSRVALPILPRQANLHPEKVGLTLGTCSLGI